MWGNANPKQESWYLCTVRSTHGNKVMSLFRMEYPKGHFIWTGLNCGEVVASIKFPKPWCGEKKGSIEK